MANYGFPRLHNASNVDLELESWFHYVGTAYQLKELHEDMAQRDKERFNVAILWFQLDWHPFFHMVMNNNLLKYMLLPLPFAHTK